MTLFMRDHLTDSGQIPSPGYPYYSPDVIAHAQVADPFQFFRDNYTADPNQPVQLGSRQNLIYTRAKNLATTPLTGWHISVYRASVSLFLNTDVWRNNRLVTAEGNSSVPLERAEGSAIVAARKPLILDATSSNLFCLIGITSSGPDPVIPERFASFDAYILWVRNSRNVCGRNLKMIRDFADRTYEVQYGVSNPEGKEVLTVLQLTVTGNLPSGTKLGVTCEPAGMNREWTFTGTVRKFAETGYMPKHFDGFARVWATLPSGGRWPSDVRIKCEKIVQRPRDAPSAPYAMPSAEVALEGDAAALFEELDGVLVLVGSCAALFVTSA